MTPATVMMDVRTSFVTQEGTSYTLNYDLTYRGPVGLREALASSYNVVIVKVLDTIGVEAMTSLARRMGIHSFDDPDRLGLAVTLGGGEVSLLELGSAYAVLANSGYAVTPQFVSSVTDSQGAVLWQRECASAVSCLRRACWTSASPTCSPISSRDDSARIPTFGEGSVLARPTCSRQDRRRPTSATTGR